MTTVVTLVLLKRTTFKDTVPGETPDGSVKALVPEAKAMPVLVFRMVSVVVVGAARVAPPVGLDRTTVRFCGPSAVVVLRTCTANARLISPSPNVSTPLVAAYLTGAVAVPSCVPKLTETRPEEPLVRMTVMKASV